MNRVFADMDGVIVDFEAYKTLHGLTADEAKKRPGSYLAMPAIPGAVQAIRSVIDMGFEVWIATKPPTGIPHAYSDKAAWILEHLPELERRIIITHNKGLLGDAGDVLCDDRPHKANCEKFPGTLLRFVNGFHWPQALDYLRELKGEHPKCGLHDPVIDVLGGDKVEPCFGDATNDHDHAQLECKHCVRDIAQALDAGGIDMRVREALIQMGWAPPSVGGWIPHDEQENILGILWMLLRGVEERTDPKKNALTAKDVEDTYALLNKIGYTQETPRWKPANATRETGHERA